MRPFWIDDPQGKTATAVDESICPVRPIDPPFGRRFHPRCPRAQVFSAAKDPACGNAGLGHIVHCLYPVERWPLDDPTDLARIESIPAVTRSWTIGSHAGYAVHHGTDRVAPYRGRRRSPGVGGTPWPRSQIRGPEIAAALSIGRADALRGRVPVRQR